LLDSLLQEITINLQFFPFYSLNIQAETWMKILNQI